MDPVTDILGAMRVGGVCHARLEATAPWAVEWSSGAYASFGFLLEGSAWLADERVALAAGDFFLLAPGRSVRLQDTDGPREPSSPSACHGETIRVGAGGPPATILTGRFHFDEASLSHILPPALHIPAAQAQGAALGAALDLLASAAAPAGPGAQLAAQRLADVILIQAMRAYMSMPGGVEAGWLRAVADPHIGVSIRSIHERMEHRWTVALLASAAGMSRSAFAQRFKELTGVAPLEYLRQWRMLRASRLLRETDRKLADVAQSVGYDSGGAFLKAFKRVLGVAPGEYRRTTPHAT